MIINGHVTFDSRFWQPYEKNWLLGLQTLDQLAEIATLFILPRMAKTQKTIVQVSGPSTAEGVSFLAPAKSRFEEVVKVLERNGLLVFDQRPFEHALRKIVEEHRRRRQNHEDQVLGRFYEPLYASRLIIKAIFLPNWQTSQFANWERKYLAGTRVEVEDLETDTDDRNKTASSKLPLEVNQP